MRARDEDRRPTAHSHGVDDSRAPPGDDPGNAEAREPLAQFPGFDAFYFVTPGPGSSSGNHPVGMMPREGGMRTIPLLP
jgi:hypothetical protein